MVRRYKSTIAMVFWILAAWSVHPFPAGAGNTPDSLDPGRSEIYHDQALSNISDILERETAIATKTNLNADYVPGMVTVLYGEDLEKRGIRTVLEAMDLVPGWNVSHRLVVRGVQDLFAPTKIKLMLNNTPMNATTCGTTSVMNMPIEAVRRIEIIRGPGSAVHGKWASLGLVNIVTHDTSNKIFTRAGSYDAFGGGVQLAFSRPSDEFSLSLNASTEDRGRTDIVSGPDSLYGTPFEAFSQAPGPVNDSSEVTHAVGSVKFRNITVLGQRFQYGVGSMFGMADALPPLDDRKVEHQDVDMVDARWRPESSGMHDVDVFWGWRRASWWLDRKYLYPPGFGGYENGVIIGPYYKEQSYRGGMDIHLRLVEKHAFLVGIEYENVELLDSWNEGNVDTHTLAPVEGIRRFETCDSWLAQCLTQKTISVSLQDQYRILDALTVTGGVRYDKYSNFDERYSPRISGVYALTDQHILKLQYAEAFRPPTLIEAYARSAIGVQGNPDIDFETTRTTELGYVLRHDRIEARLTVFYSDLRKLIVVRDNQYQNLGKAESRGAELEAAWTLSSALEIDGSVSYADTEEDETGREIPGASRWLGNAGFRYSFLNDYTLAMQYHYVGKRFRTAYDPRSSIKAYGRTDGALSIEHFMVSGLTLRLGVRNLLKEDIRIPSVFGGYPEDYPAPGREWWVQASLKF